MAAPFGIPGKEIFLDVDTEHRHWLSKNVIKAVIGGKRQVGVSATAIYGREHAPLCAIQAADLLDCLVYNCQELINLPEFALHAGFHFSLARRDAKLMQERSRIVSPQQ